MKRPPLKAELANPPLDEYGTASRNKKKIGEMVACWDSQGRGSPLALLRPGLIDSIDRGAQSNRLRYYVYLAVVHIMNQAFF